MNRVRTVPQCGIRAILCLKFKQQAPYDRVAEFKQSLIASDEVLHSVDVSGSFDFMAEAECRDFTQYQDLLETMSLRYGDLVDHYEASFVCRRYVRQDADDPKDRHIWLPSGAGLQRLDHDRIDRVSAEGDYVRVHSGSASWLVHMTMRSIAEQLGSERFLRLSRSLIVRTDFIERLVHNSRRWFARLDDGSEHAIAKSRSAAVIARLKLDSSSTGLLIADRDRSSENGAQPTENALP